jgi:hypothetical protein
VYIPAIIGYVPDEVVECLTVFLDSCYIARRQDIDSNALEALDFAVDKFRQLREVFRIPGVRPKGFLLPRQHALFHYRRLIEDFGAPGGLCSSITESRHITAVKKPWRQSNRYNALGQMLLINQRLDKLAAMHSDFAARGMIPAGHAAGRQITHLLKRSQRSRQDFDYEVEDNEPVDSDSEGQDVLGHVILAHTRGTPFNPVDERYLIGRSSQVPTGHR